MGVLGERDNAGPALSFPAHTRMAPSEVPVQCGKTPLENADSPNISTSSLILVLLYKATNVDINVQLIFVDLHHSHTLQTL